jgi:glucans biosynthesis protein C
MSTNGALTRRWTVWLFGGVRFCLWITLTAIAMDRAGVASIGLQVANDLGFVIAYATSCLFFVAFFSRFCQHQSSWLDSPSSNAYGLYILHYVFVVWTQYLLLDAALFAVAKGYHSIQCKTGDEFMVLQSLGFFKVQPKHIRALGVKGNVSQEAE